MLFLNNSKAVNKLGGRSKTPVGPKAKAPKSKTPRTPMPELEVDLMIRDRLDIADRHDSGNASNDQARVDARNNLKSYCYNMVEKMDDGLFDKADKNTMMTICTQNLEWTLAHESASQKEFESRLSHMIAVCDPIVAKYEK